MRKCNEQEYEKKKISMAYEIVAEDDIFWPFLKNPLASPFPTIVVVVVSWCYYRVSVQLGGHLLLTV